MKHIAISVMIVLTISACSTIQSPEDNHLAQSKPRECIAEQATKLIGQENLSEAQIKQMTQASTVRKTNPNQPVTMDYRFDRVTVVVDPVSQKIIQASCG